MNRTFKFLGELTDEGFITHDRDEVRTCLLDLEGAVFQLGGIVQMTAIREQIAPNEWATTGVLVAYDSYAPARESAPARDPEIEAVPEVETA
jgi:hypothetical protein